MYLEFILPPFSYHCASRHFPTVVRHMMVDGRVTQDDNEDVDDDDDEDEDDGDDDDMNSILLFHSITLWLVELYAICLGNQ